MKKSDFFQIENFLCFRQDVSTSRAGLVKDSYAGRLRAVISANIDWSNINLSDLSDQRTLKTAIFGVAEPEIAFARQKGLFEYDEILKLWFRMNIDQKKKLASYNDVDVDMTPEEFISKLPERSFLESLDFDDDWFFPVAYKIEDASKDEYWRFDTIPLMAEGDACGFLFVSTRELTTHVLTNIFERKNAYSRMTTVWQDLYKILRRSADISGIFIGGKHQPTLSVDSLSILRNRLVGQSEVAHYIEVQNSRSLEELGQPVDIDTTRAQSLMAKQQSARSSTIHIATEQNITAISQVNQRLKVFHSELEQRLSEGNSARDKWDEKSFQSLLFKIFPFIFPQYTHFIREYRFKINGNLLKKEEIPDFIALSASLSVDVIEIKTPYFPLFRRSLYRKNWVFGSEVQGLISQSQKYIYNLTRNSAREEPNLQRRFIKDGGLILSDDSSGVHIRSPKAIIIVGRCPSYMIDDPGVAHQREQDFDIYKRRYEDILSFLTFDDVLDLTRRMISRQTKI